jgi:hypothetical protein
MKYFLLGVCVLIAVTGAAQDKKEKKVEEKTPVYNYTVGNDPMEAFGPLSYAEKTYKYFPEFYVRQAYDHSDTTFKFECYDSRDSIMNFSSIDDITKVRFISLFKSYPDKAHPFTDAKDGVRKPLPVSSIIRRFDRVGDDKWLSVDYATNKYSKLKEYRTNVVRTDTVVIEDPVSHKEKATIYCYYKVETIK